MARGFLWVRFKQTAQQAEPPPLSRCQEQRPMTPFRHTAAGFSCSRA